jgi:predicted kinase
MSFGHIFAILSYMKSLSLAKPHLIIMVGVPGSGKSFFADKFTDTFHTPIVSREKIISRLGQDIKEADAIAHDQLDELLKTQQSIVLDGMCDGRAARGDVIRKAHSAGYETLLVWVQTDPTTAKSRSSRPASDTYNRVFAGETYDKAAKQFTPPTPAEKPIVISGKHTYATQAKVVLKKLSAPRANISLHAAAPIRPEPSRRRNISIR